ncbi:MAG: sulfatase-like hydrolase/transferase, partial [Phycisphaerae bacterium]
MTPLRAALLILALLPSLAFAQRKPNVVLIFCDDLGYGDLACFGSKTIATPNLDKLATQGMRLTDFHTDSPVCTPSRAALLTGSHAARIGLEKHVLFPRSRIGLSPSEVTIAKLLKGQGYATAAIGKWHLGDAPEFLPTAHGFDSYFGVP